MNGNLNDRLIAAFAMLGAGLDAALQAARGEGFDGLLVKAQADANGFFAARGLSRLPAEKPERDYPHRYWQAV